MGKSQPRRVCSVDGCERPHLARGLCRLHYHREWRARNPELARKYQRERRARNPDLFLKYEREWRARNPELVRKYQREWRARNLELARKYQRERVRMRYATDPEWRANELARCALNKGFNRVMG